MSMATPDVALRRAIAFLDKIGLAPELVDALPALSFLPGVRITRGRLLLTPVCPASNLLHEAGHLACLPPPYRESVDGDVSCAIRAMFAHLHTLDLEPDHPLMRAALQCSDPEATAWAWAAGLASGLAPADIIQDTEYAGDGASLRCMLSTGHYAGIHGLAHAGLCRLPRHPGGYPAMRRWLQDATPAASRASA